MAASNKTPVAGVSIAAGAEDLGDQYRGEESCRVARALARLDAADGAIAEALGVSRPTLNAWRQRHAEFSEALRARSNLNDGAIARAAIRNALGYYHQVDTTINTPAGSIVRKQFVYQEPDKEASRLLLRIRMGFDNKSSKRVDPNEDWLKFARKFRGKKTEDRFPANLPIEDGCRIAKTMNRLGATDEEISDALGITLSDFENVRDKNEKFSAALKAGKELLDAALERSLMQRALGYSHFLDPISCTRAGDIVRFLDPKWLEAELGDMWWRV